MMKWGGFLALLGCSSAKDKMAHSRLASEPVVTIGPLEIHCDIERTASGAWYNQGGKPGYKDVTSYFSVKHQGKLVPVTTASGTTTHFWQALVLKDAPMPAVLVATHSVYLITDENGQLTQKPLDQNENDFAKYQWLDGENGRSGKQQKVYLGDDSKSSRFLSGGRFLIVNTRMLLDVQSLATYPIDNF